MVSMKSGCSRKILHNYIYGPTTLEVLPTPMYGTSMHESRLHAWAYPKDCGSVVSANKGFYALGANE